MLKITQERVRHTGEYRNWSLEEHIEQVYNVLRFQRNWPPLLVHRPGESRPAVHQILLDWKAGLGALHHTDWQGFLRRHQSLLSPLASLSRLGRLSDADIDLVCSIVRDLESFKNTQSRMLVFGSKAAHIHFPWLVPVMSSEVRQGLGNLMRSHSAEVNRCLGGETALQFSFTRPEECFRSFRHYVALGNWMCRDLDANKMLGVPRLKYDLHAKAFEWWVVSFEERRR